MNRRYSYCACFAACAFLNLNLAAGEPSAPGASAAPDYRPFTLGVEAATTGFGGSAAWRFSDHLGVRFGLDYFKYSDSRFGIESLSYDAKIRVMSEPLLLDIYPWKNHSFRISVGMMFNQNRLTGTASDEGNVFPPLKLGEVGLDVQQQPVNPYLSIGGNLLYFDRAHRWALAGELGVAYTGDPRITITRTGPPSDFLDAALNRAEDQAHHYAEKFMWWPVVKLMVTYSF